MLVSRRYLADRVAEAWYEDGRRCTTAAAEGAPLIL